MKSAFDGKHLKMVAVAVLVHPDSDNEGAYAGRIVANWSDNPNGSTCTATVSIHEGPLSFIPIVSGKAGGCGYDKLSAAIYDALYRAREGTGDAWKYVYEEDKTKCKALTFPDFNGAGFGAVRTWLRTHGYIVVGEVGCS